MVVLPALSVTFLWLPLWSFEIFPGLLVEMFAVDPFFILLFLAFDYFSAFCLDSIQIHYCSQGEFNGQNLTETI